VPDFITFFMCIYTCILRKTTTAKTTSFSLHLINNKSNINEIPNATNNDDDLMDSNDDELVDEIIRDKVTKESFLQMVENVSIGGDLLIIINLPSLSQCYGHSITMNAIIKIISRHATFKDRCTAFYTTKIKSGKEPGDINIQHSDSK